MLKIVSKPFNWACLLLIAGVCILSPGCAKQQQERKEQPPPPPLLARSPDPATAKKLAELPPPQPAEVNNAVERVFKNAVTIETNRNPYFTVGDFNGDLSQDLAVVVKPAPGKLPEINDELANWILVDPVRQAVSSSKIMPQREMHKQIIRQQRVRVNEGDVLLAVIHGYEAKGWRDPWATQTYILKGSIGNELRAQAHKQVVRNDNKEKLPRIWGDVIAQNIGGQSGFLFYNGAKYAWYDPSTYKPGPPTRLVHGKAEEKVRY